MANIDIFYDKFIGKDSQKFLQTYRNHRLNLDNGPTLLKNTKKRLCGQPEEYDLMTIYAITKLCPPGDVIDGFGQYHTSVLPKKYWTSRMKRLVASAAPKSYFGCAAGDICIIIDGLAYFIDMKISENDIKEDENETLYFTGCIPSSSLTNFPHGDNRHFYLLFPKVANDPRGKVYLVDADALAIERDSGNLRSRRNGSIYVAQDILKLKNASEIIREII